MTGDRWMTRIELTDSDLRDIGKFTRENCFKVGRAKKKHSFIGVEILGWGIWDVHAVCGDVDIPWANEGAKEIWGTAWQKRNNVGS